MGFFARAREMLGLTKLPDEQRALDISYDFSDRNEDHTWFSLDQAGRRAVDEGFDAPATVQRLLLKNLVDNDLAEEVDGGFSVPNEVIAGLDPEYKEVLNLPALFTGEIELRFEGTTASERFDAEITTSVSGQRRRLELDGPFVTPDKRTTYSVDLPLFTALVAIQQFRKAKQDGAAQEVDRVQLVFDLKQAQDSGLAINLGHLQDFNISKASSVGLAAERLSKGALSLKPVIEGLDPDSVLRKLHQTPRGAESALLREDRKFVILGKREVEALYEIADSNVIFAKNAEHFLRSPGTFLNGDLVDLDDFSSRVLGIGVINESKDPEAKQFSQEWFADDGRPYTPEILHSLVTSPEELEEAQEIIDEAHGHGEDLAVVQETVIDVSDKEQVRRTFAEVKAELEQPEPTDVEIAESTQSTVKIGIITEDVDEDIPDLTRRALAATLENDIDYSDLLRQPFPHQREGIEWMAGLMNESFQDSRVDMYRLSGALLADDMGLGKTYVTLVALREFMRLDVKYTGVSRPILGVLPVALLENWVSEVKQTFSESPFDEVVVLHGSTLDTYRARPGGETMASLEDLSDDLLIDPSQIRYALKVGTGHGASRLDKPRRLVLTTYDVLRQYQLSLASVDWGVAFFDEAQRVKEPTTQVTKAARAIKAGFTLMATGTPVENSLQNIFTLFDIAQPGLLGDWISFRKQWIPQSHGTEGTDLADIRLEKGRQLRQLIGPFMLRRTKEDELQNMPKKTIHSALTFTDAEDVEFNEWLAGPMSAMQEQLYDAVLADHKSSKSDKNNALQTLQRLREVSLHPDVHLNKESSWTAHRTSQETRHVMEESGRFIATLEALDRIKAADEKVIIFAINRKLQFALQLWMKALYGLDIHVVNGETKAAATSERDAHETRAARIKEFESQEGFNVIVMSPLAAGVGLTVVGANHVIHLERHWNPAKEAQATDRVYRIGQKKPVHVYLPVSKHSRLTSFDERLNELLLTKTDIKNAVMSPESADEKKALSPMSAILD